MNFKPSPEFKSISWEDFTKFSPSDKIQYFSYRNRIFDVLFSQQFSRRCLDQLYHLTNKIREISKKKAGKAYLSSLLKDYRVMLYFIQPSTRTFLSFSSACSILGLNNFNVRSCETSSEVKGESFEDTIRTFSSYFDLIIMRHPQKGSAEKAAFIINKSGRPIPVINAGSGKDQHPTQALLDIYTLRRSFEKTGGLEGKTIMMVGDLKRGRTVRSLCYLLSNFSKVKIILSSPNIFKMEPDIKHFLTEKKVDFYETDEFKPFLKDIDAVYMTRLQEEYHDDRLENHSIYQDGRYKLDQNCLNLMKPSAIVMHPLPRRDEIDRSIDESPQAIYWRQMRNGMWTRCALISLIFGLEKKIHRY